MGSEMCIRDRAELALADFKNPFTPSSAGVTDAANDNKGFTAMVANTDDDAETPKWLTAVAIVLVTPTYVRE